MYPDFFLLGSKWPAIALCFVLELVAFRSSGQTGCSCPATGTCGPCTGGLTSLTIKYTGIGITISVDDGGGNLFTGSVLTGATITVHSSAGAGQLFVGNFVKVTGTLLFTETMATNCTDPVTPGTVYQYFTVVGSTDKISGTVCCAPADDDHVAPTFTTACPSNIQVFTTAGSCTATATWTPPVATDNCGTVNLTSNHNPGETFSLGTTTVTYTATDQHNNTSTCSFTVTVKDNIAPTITSCPSSANVFLNSSCNYTIPTYTATVSDNCGATLTQSPVAGTVISGHNTAQLITLTATDAAGNSASCSFTITLKDNVAPTITSCPSNANVFVNASCSYTIPTYTATVSDNCGATLTQSPAAGTVLSGHNTSQLITLKATDAAGNQSSCSFTITLKDNIAPTISSCPSSGNVFLNASCKFTLPAYTATVTDNCGAATLTQTPAAGTVLSGHNTAQLVTLTATDAAGNVSSCSFTITLKDNTAPAISSCPSNANVFLNASCKFTLPAYTATVTDNCGTPTLTQSPVAGTVLSGHNTAQLVTLTATDAAGNSSSCSFTITLKDNVAPTISSCPSNANVFVNASCKYTLPAYTATVTDNCGATLTQSPAAGTVLTGHNTSQLITLTATDAAGNASSCSFTITLKDNTAPVISGCPSNISVSAGTSSCNAVVNWTAPTAPDNCSTASLTSNHNSGDTFPVGTTTVTYNAVDAAGNSATCSFTVKVIENIAPVITNCPSNANVFLDASCKFTLPAYTATVTDNCGAATLTQSPVAGTVLTGHNTAQLVTLTATDAAGNSSSCSFTITLKDNVAPTISSCPVNANVSVDASCKFTLPAYTATVTDNCGATLAQSPAAGTVLTGHNTSQLITLTATDAAGNASSCSFTITLKDNTAPVISGCPSNISVSAGTSSCNAVVNWTAPTASDNCSTASLTSNHNSGDTFPVGTTTVTYNAVDAAGNSATCSFTVKVIENIAPVITNCPSNANVFLDASCKFTLPAYTATVTDNCGATLTQSPVAGTVLTGHNTKQLITLTATDAAGNASSCSFTITLKDNIAPTISSCPVNANVFVDAGCKFTLPAYTPTVTDNCGTTLTQSPVAGTVLTGHNTSQLVTLTATDAAGNASTCSFTITLKDNLAPVITNCPADIAVTAQGSCNATATWTSPTVSDNCSSTPSLSSNHVSGTTFSFGTTVVTYTATDNAGNTSTCSFKVTVSNNSIPVFSNCPTDIKLDTDDPAGIKATWIEPTASATCGKVTLTSSFPPGSLFQVGSTEVKYVATLDDGATASCTFKVIVTYNKVNLEVDQLITPNGDGINDRLRVKNLELFTDNDLVIVDRWGSLIYSASGYNNESVSWDGSNKNGARVPTGTYFYTISVNVRGQRITKKGFIELAW